MRERLSTVEDLPESTTVGCELGGSGVTAFGGSHAEMSVITPGLGGSGVTAFGGSHPAVSVGRNAMVPFVLPLGSTGGVGVCAFMSRCAPGTVVDITVRSDEPAFASRNLLEWAAMRS